MRSSNSLIPCIACEATGIVAKENCPTCRGTKRVLDALQFVDRTQLGIERDRAVAKYKQFYTDPSNKGFTDEMFREVDELARSRYGTPIDCGRSRLVFRDRDFVVKVPRSEMGIFANEQELFESGEQRAWTNVDDLTWKIFSGVGSTYGVRAPYGIVGPSELDLDDRLRTAWMDDRRAPCSV